jgi:hypothetical protein
MFFDLSFFILFLYYPLFCPMFSDGVRVKDLSAPGISFQTLDKCVGANNKNIGVLGTIR